MTHQSFVVTDSYQRVWIRAHVTKVEGVLGYWLHGDVTARKCLLKLQARRHEFVI